MNCKNCHTELQEKDDYCRSCGGKVIKNRLSFRNLFEHLSETFFNYDNKLLRTYIQLFKDPEDVTDGYIKGVRKKYVNPISYLGIALTLTGIVIFIMKRIQFKVNYDIFNTGINENYMTKVQAFTTEYSSIIFLSYIPLLVAASWLMLKNRNYNITERTVTFIYLISQSSITTILPSIVILLVIPQFYVNYSFFLTIFLVAYLAWSMYKISKLKGIEFIGQVMVFIVLFGIIYIAYSIGLVIMGLITGYFEFSDFMPDKP